MKMKPPEDADMNKTEQQRLTQKLSQAGLRFVLGVKPAADACVSGRFRTNNLTGPVFQ